MQKTQDPSITQCYNKQKGICETERWRNIVNKGIKKRDEPDIMVKVLIEYVPENKFYIKSNGKES
jgi:hypothetical protein